MDIKLSDSQMQELVSAAIVQVMTADVRETVITEAIKHLITPVKRDSYSSRSGTSPIQDAFDRAIEVYATREARAWLESQPETMLRIQEIYLAAWQKMIQDYQPDLIEKIAQRMALALTER